MVNAQASVVAKGALPSLRLRVEGVPATKARELTRAAILPLAKSYAAVTLSVTIAASGGDGMTQSDLDLTVLEGLRQLGLDDVRLEEL